MREANYLKQVLSLLEGDREAQIRRYYIRIFLALGIGVAVAGFGIWLRNFQMFALVGFLAGIAYSALERTKNIEILLPHIDQESVKSRLESPDA